MRIPRFIYFCMALLFPMVPQHPDGGLHPLQPPAADRAPRCKATAILWLPLRATAGRQTRGEGLLRAPPGSSGPTLMGSSQLPGGFRRPGKSVDKPTCEDSAAPCVYSPNGCE